MRKLLMIISATVMLSSCHNRQTAFKQAWDCIDRGDPGLAIVCAQMSLEDDSTYMYALDAMSLAWLQVKQYDSAHFYAEKLKDLKPKNWEQLYFFRKGTIFDHQGDWDNALKYYRESIAVDSTCAEAYDNISFYYISVEKDTATAYQYRKKAAELGLQSAIDWFKEYGEKYKRFDHK